MLEEKEYMMNMAWKFFVAMIRHKLAQWRGYEVLTPKAQLAYRDSRCAGCCFNEEGQCSMCKCLTLSKTVMALEECPIGLWHRVWIKRKQ
jgi:hypothetical protein